MRIFSISLYILLNVSRARCVSSERQVELPWTELEATLSLFHKVPQALSTATIKLMKSEI